jgi:hypothetical protein
LFRSNDFWPSYGPWTLKFGQIFSCHHFISLIWFEILTWFLVWECIIISYRSTLNSFRLNDFWATYSHCLHWALKFGQIFSCHHFISLWFEILTWFLVCECIVILSYRSSLNFVPIEWFRANLRTFEFKLWSNIFSCHHFISLCFEILTWFLVFGTTMMSYRSSLAFVPTK